MTGLAYGDWASGGNRYGIVVEGPAAFNGPLTDVGTITIQGNNSYGSVRQWADERQLMMLDVTPANGSNPTSVQNGSINVTGNNDIGLYVSPTGADNGNIRITSITARGIDAAGRGDRR